MKIAIIGATGLVGQELLAIAAAQAGAELQLGLFASADSAGQRISFRGTALTVQALPDCDFSAYDAAFFCIGDELSARYVPRAVAGGCLVVDKSNAFRMQPDVPLVVAGVNDAALAEGTRLAANPNCSTIILLHALNPWRQFGLCGVWVATYQSVSGAGKSGPERLTQGLASQAAQALMPRPQWDGAGFAHNVIPAVGDLGEDGRCSEESKLIQESRKILSMPELRVVAHAARVPVFVGHSMAVTVELEQAVTEPELLAAWSAAEEYVQPVTAGWPTPLSAMQHDRVEVGRLRTEDESGRCWSFFASGDNLTLGAALNGWRMLMLLARNSRPADEKAGGA